MGGVASTATATVVIVVTRFNINTNTGKLCGGEYPILRRIMQTPFVQNTTCNPWIIPTL